MAWYWRWPLMLGLWTLFWVLIEVSRHLPYDGLLSFSAGNIVVLLAGVCASASGALPSRADT